MTQQMNFAGDQLDGAGSSALTVCRVESSSPNKSSSKTRMPVTAQGPRHFSRRFVIKSVLSNWSYLIVNLLVAFWMTPFVVHHLGTDDYGIWALVLQLTGYMGVVDVGLRSALVRFVAKFQAQGNAEELSELLNCTLVLYGLMLPICFAFAAVVAFVAVPHMQLPPGALGITQITVFLAAGCISVDFLFATPHACLAGFSRWDITNGVWIGVLLVRTALTVLLLRAGYGLVTLGLIQLSVNLAGYLAEVVLLRRVLPNFRIRPRLLSLDRIRPILGHGWNSFLLSIANRVNYQVDSIVIALFLPIQAVTFYVIGMRLVEYLRDFLNSTTVILAPIVSSLEAVGEAQNVVRAIFRSTRYSLIVGFLGCVALITLGPSFIYVWMGSAFTEQSGKVLIILTVGLIAACSQFAIAHVLFGLSRHQLNVTWTFIESALNLLFSLILVRRFGIYGVAAGTMVGNIVIRGWLFPRSFLKIFDINWKKYVQLAVLPAAVPAILFAGGILLSRKLFAIQNYQGLAGAFGCGLVPCLIGLWFFGLDAEDRALVQRKTRQRVAHEPV